LPLLLVIGLQLFSNENRRRGQLLLNSSAWISSGTRNSLVVLPLALALPENWSTLVAATTVKQTIVELAGELIYVRFVPNVVLRDTVNQASSE
jgi:hypothetical protein